MYHIVEKFEIIDGMVAYRDIGYLSEGDDVDTLNAEYNDYKTWLRVNEEERKSQTIDDTDYDGFPFYGSRKSTTNIYATGLSLIEDITNPEGV
jgi:hypothetical protein